MSVKREGATAKDAKDANPEPQVVEVAPTHVMLAVDLINEVLQYLARRPYGEVAVLIEKVQRGAVPVKTAEPKPEVVEGP